MERSNKQSGLVCLLSEANVKGLTGEKLKILSGLNTEGFDAAAGELWGEGELIGAKENGCCGDRCGAYCVSYMKLEHVWHLGSWYLGSE